jgi:hypothetical protein
MMSIRKETIDEHEQTRCRRARGCFRRAICGVSAGSSDRAAAGSTNKVVLFAPQGLAVATSTNPGSVVLDTILGREISVAPLRTIADIQFS